MEQRVSEGGAIRNPEGFLELIPMRPDERIDAARVGEYLQDQLPGVRGTPEILQFEGGKANLTYLLRFGEQEFVLRRPPLGPVAPKAHDMERESRVLAVLHRAYPLAPRAYHFCADPAIVGAPFFVMERRKGIVIREKMPGRFLGQPELYRRMSEMIVDALARLHLVEPGPLGLETLGRPEGFLQRQIGGWLKRWEGAKIEEVPRFDRLHDWLLRRVPKSQRVALLHNDYKLDNMMVNQADPAIPVAVFDWDMCTLGDPLADLGTLLGYWTEAGDSEARKAFGPMPTALPGFYTREQVIERYARTSGLDLSEARFYEIFALYKSTVIIQQIYVRFHRGQTQDVRFRNYGQKALGLLEAAWELVDGAA
jgi:aminoglycoside phosphotransferase (APT) family kinase protein